MYDDGSLDGWYAIFVSTGEEDNVKERLKYRFGDELRFVVPKRKIRERKDGKVRDVLKLLFPGYVLVRGQIDIPQYERFRNVPGMIKLLGDAGKPKKIEAYEMELISRLIVNDEIIGYSKIFEENGLVRVVDGPMMSLEGNIVSIDRRKGRAKVRLFLFGDERVVDLGIEILKPAEVYVED